jgi:DNA primase
VYKNNKLIFWQGRDLVGTRVKKYISPDVARDNIMYGYDRLMDHSPDPLYVVEGWFDAVHVDGIAVFGNQLTPAQVYWLSKSPRAKVVIPDKYGDGHLLAKQALKLGWSLSLPDCGSCKDVSDMVSKYGSIYTYKTIRENTVSGFEAEALLGLYCKKA